MTPFVRKFMLVAHIVSSVGWLGSVAVFLAFAIAGLISADPQTVRAVYLGTDMTTWLVIVPLAFVTLLTGFVVSLGTPWGLFRHYWVVAKLMISSFATLLLLLHTRPIGVLAEMARATTWSSAQARPLQIQVMSDAAAALFALLINVALSVYKPRGLTSYGRRKSQELSQTSHAVATSRVKDASNRGQRDSHVVVGSTPRWVRIFGAVVVASVLLFRLVILHLGGGGHSHLHWSH